MVPAFQASLFNRETAACMCTAQMSDRQPRHQQPSEGHRAEERLKNACLSERVPERSEANAGSRGWAIVR